MPTEGRGKERRKRTVFGGVLKCHGVGPAGLSVGEDKSSTKIALCACNICSYTQIEEQGTDKQVPVAIIA
jgi:hypothetical protein